MWRVARNAGGRGDAWLARDATVALHRLHPSPCTPLSACRRLAVAVTAAARTIPAHNFMYSIPGTEESTAFLPSTGQHMHGTCNGTGGTGTLRSRLHWTVCVIYTPAEVAPVNP